LKTTLENREFVTPLAAPRRGLVLQVPRWERPTIFVHVILEYGVVGLITTVIRDQGPLYSRSPRNITTMQIYRPHAPYCSLAAYQKHSTRRGGPRRRDLSAEIIHILMTMKYIYCYGVGILFISLIGLGYVCIHLFKK
jgi:hypothetical protein